MEPINKKTGFTIVELLIVIVVIAILAAISVVAYNGVQERSLNSARLSEAKQWQQLIMLYGVQNSSYPTAIPVSGTACLGTGFPDSNSDGIGDCWDLHVPGHTSINSALNTQLSTVGSLPNNTRKPVPGDGTTSRIGPALQRGSSYSMTYWLAGREECNIGSQVWSDGSSKACRYTFPNL